MAYLQQYWPFILCIHGRTVIGQADSRRKDFEQQLDDLEQLRLAASTV